MLFRTKQGGRTLYKSHPLLLSPKQGYTRPTEGKEWWSTTTTVWRVDEIIRRRVRDWRRLLGETGHDGSRAETMRSDHDSVYTGTHSVFPAPLMEYIVLRYGGPIGGRILDAFAGGPPRGVVSSIMGMEYCGVELRQEQIDENEKVLKELGLKNFAFHLGDAREMDHYKLGQFDSAITCPPYWNLEKYSDDPLDLSNYPDYVSFNTAMLKVAEAHFPMLKPGAFACIVVGPFRDKKTGELIDFPGDTVRNFQDAGFIYWQQVVLEKNFASAAKRSTNAWRGHKLVPCHEFLLVFRKPE